MEQAYIKWLPHVAIFASRALEFSFYPDMVDVLDRCADRIQSRKISALLRENLVRVHGYCSFNRAWSTGISQTQFLPNQSEEIAVIQTEWRLRNRMMNDTLWETTIKKTICQKMS